jgi:diguanylate cyclase (GGDEF)-like protein/PAS domain S-box-containing protein
MKLQVKTSLFLSALLLIALLSLGGILSFFLDRSLLSKANKDLLEEASQVASRLDMFIDNVQTDMRNIAQHLDIQAIRNGKWEKNESHLRSAYFANSHFDNGFFMLDSQGILKVDYPVSGSRGGNFSFREYFQKTVAVKKQIVSNPYRSKRTGAMVISFTVPLLTSDGKILGLLVGSVNLQRRNFAGGLKDIQIGRTGKILVYEPKGKILYYPESGLISPEGDPLKGNPLFQSLPKGKSGIIDRLGADGKKYLMGFRPLQTADWMVGIMMEKKEIFAPLHDLQKQIALFLLAALLTATGIGIWGMEIFIRPIKALSKGIRDFKGGKWEEPTGLLTRSDEIGELGHSFKNMTTLLNETLTSLQESEARYRTIFEQSNDGIAVVKGNQHFYVNQKMVEMFGYDSADEIIGQPLSLLVDPEDLPRVQDLNLRRQKGEDVKSQYEFKGRKKNGESIYIEVSAAKTIYQGEPISLAFLRNITDRKQVEERLQALSLRDDLTGLYNRRGFYTLAEQAMKAVQRMGTEMLLIYGDLDNFKRINDALGHQEGDQALIDLAAILKETFRESDIIARMGGDEFVILAMNSNESSADSLILRFDKALKDHHLHKDRPYTLSMSLGMARFTHDSPLSLDFLLSQADKMMYANKQKKGRE